MSTELHLKEILPIIEEKLNLGSEVTINPGGISMLPLIKSGRDSVVLIKAPEKLKKYDVALYRRKTGQFVLHRVIGFKDGNYVMCGDNQYWKEFGINHNEIIAVMKAVIRNKKYISVNNLTYRIYSVLRVFMQKINRNLRRIKRIPKAIIRRILRG